jgi:hypothetical protein
MRYDITCQTTEHTKRGNVESEEVWLCHFLMPMDGSLGER